MRKTEVEVYSEETNRAIVRMPNRHFPGCVIQGDSLSVLYRSAKEIYKRVEKSEDTELISESKRLFEILDSIILHYEFVLDEHGISIPYSPDMVLKDILDWQKKSET